ncbi:MAG TPA: hypothetical protein VGO93_31610 [Candidatus Xenobia bacterium]|jgi:hypothetical protein
MSETPDGEVVLDSQRGHHNGKRVEDGDPYSRAEETFDQIGQRVGQYVAEAGKWLNRVTHRAREEAEDMMVEAQDLRRRWQSPR